MIRPDAVPSSHTPPLPRVDLGARPPREPDAATIDLNCIDRFIEQDRIWDLVRQAAGAEVAMI